MEENTPLIGNNNNNQNPVSIVVKPYFGSKWAEGEYNLISAFLIFFFPALGGLLFGYDIGATSAVITQLKSSAYSGVVWYNIVANSSLLQGVITSIGMLGAMLGK